MNNIKFFINKEKRVVTAVSAYNGSYVRGIARCCPEDDFDIDLGKSLAAARVKLKIERKRMQDAEKILSETAKLLSQAADNFKEADQDVMAAKALYRHTEKKLKAIEDNLY